jgi:anti-sigma factor RsiW
VPGTNAGTGCPITLRCAKCKRRGWEHRRGYDLEVTGRSRARRRAAFERRGIRMIRRWVIEYRCRECGHVGWSRHIDAAAMLEWKTKLEGGDHVPVDP